MKNNHFKKEYIAVLDGILSEKSGTISAPIARKDNSIIERCVDFKNGEIAITHYDLIKNINNSCSLVHFVLETGRTHQIRVHMAYIGYPIYNDPVYGKRKETTNFGQFLHSKKISFYHPISKELLEKEVALPKEFTEYLEEIDIQS